MSLRALGSPLTRRLSPRTQIPRAQAVSSLGIGFTPAAAGRPAARPEEGSRRCHNNSVGCVGHDSVFQQKHREFTSIAGDGQEECRKEVLPDKKAIVEKPFPHLRKQPPRQDLHRAQEVRDWEEAVNRQVVNVDEATMKSRFEEWMKKYGKSYETKEEKARRYEAFKKNAIHADKANAAEQRDVPFAPNGLADMTDEEYRCMHLHCCGDSDWESYIDQLNAETAHAVIIGQQEVIFLSEAAKQVIDAD
uniref:Cathepsin propeptide inhibitor domain-containing protein n=1 Tax=Leersia perrieri TaxID=77586 RepID=A0A0D9WI49_9ORYZ